MTTFKWGTIAASNPLRVQIDGDTVPLPFTPDCLIDPLTVATGDRVRCEMSGNRIVVHGRSGGSSTPVGSYQYMAGRRAPSTLNPDGSLAWLKTNGAAYPAVTYPALFEYLCERLGTVAVSIASPATVTLASHGLLAGERVWFQTTGALPTGLTAGTVYFVLAAGLTANAFRLSATDGGTAINTSGTQSGVHSVRVGTYGITGGGANFNVPDTGDYVLVGQKNGSAEFGSVGRAYGAKTHTLTKAQMPSHQHTHDQADGGNLSYNGDGSTTSYGTTFGPGRNNTGIVTGTAGGGGEHNNVQPSRAVLVVIKT